MSAIKQFSALNQKIDFPTMSRRNVFAQFALDLVRYWITNSVNALFGSFWIEKFNNKFDHRRRNNQICGHAKQYLLIKLEISIYRTLSQCVRRRCRRRRDALMSKKKMWCFPSWRKSTCTLALIFLFHVFNFHLYRMRTQTRAHTHTVIPTIQTPKGKVLFVFLSYRSPLVNVGMCVRACVCVRVCDVEHLMDGLGHQVYVFNFRFICCFLRQL